MPPPKKISLLVKKTKHTTSNDSTLKPVESTDTIVSTEATPESIPEEITSTDATPETSTDTTPELSAKAIASTEASTDAHDVELDEPEPELSEEYMSLTTAQKDDLIDKLETKKHKLKKAYKKALAQNSTKELDALKNPLKEVSWLLSEVKACDAIDKVQKNMADADQVSKEFIKTHKKLAKTDFNKIIDLTAPKEERQPDISTEQIWHRSKDVIFKNKTYRKAPEDKLQKFEDKMKLKKMPKHLKKDLQYRTDNNTKAINIHQNHGDKLKYRQYDPLSFNGLNIY